MATLGTISAELSSLQFSDGNYITPTLFSISATIHAVVHYRYDGGNYVTEVTTFSMDTVGQLGSEYLDRVQLKSAARRPDTYKIAPIATGIVAITFNYSTGGTIITISIDNEGTISIIDEYLFETTFYAFYPSLTRLSGTLFALAWDNTGDNRGRLGTLHIQDNGTIGTLIDQIQTDPVHSWFPQVHVLDDSLDYIVAVVYSDGNHVTRSRTFTIGTDGMITGTFISENIVIPGDGYSADTLPYVNDIFVGVSRGVSTQDGWLTTYSQPSNGKLPTASNPIDQYEFQPVKGVDGRLAHVGGPVWAIAYRDTNNNCWLETYTIDSAGTITTTPIDQLKFHATYSSALDFKKAAGETKLYLTVACQTAGFLLIRSFEIEQPVTATANLLSDAVIVGSLTTIIESEASVFKSENSLLQSNALVQGRYGVQSDTFIEPGPKNIESNTWVARTETEVLNSIAQIYHAESVEIQSDTVIDPGSRNIETDAAIFKTVIETIQSDSVTYPGLYSDAIIISVTEIATLASQAVITRGRGTSLIEPSQRDKRRIDSKGSGKRPLRIF